MTQLLDEGRKEENTRRLPGLTVEPGNQCSDPSVMPGISGQPPKLKAATELYILCSFFMSQTFDY